MFDYYLDGDPGPLVLICPPGSGIEHARQRLFRQFGGRVIEVREHFIGDIQQ